MTTHSLRASGLSKIGALITTLMLAFAGVVASALPASAAVSYDDPRGLGRIGIQVTASDGSPMWLGNQLTTPEGNSAYCVQAFMSAPGGESVVDVTDMPIATPRVAGLELTTAQAAYLLDTYGNSQDPDVTAAVSLLIHANFEIDSPTPNVVGEYKTAQQSADYVIRVVRDAAPAIEAKALELRADAIASAAVGYQGGIPTGDGMRHGTITNIGITNAAGSYVAGKQFTITLNGSAVFDENGKNTYTGTTATTPLTLNWSATANGVVDYSTTYENVYKKLAFIDRSGNVQQTLEYGGAGVSDPETVAGVTFKVVYDFQPMGTSNIQEITTDDGAFTDTFEAYADPAYGSGEWLKFDGTDTFVPVEYKVSAYYAGVTPPTQSGTVPQGADLVGTQYVTANSPGELSADFTATNAGFVTVVWEVVKVDQAEDAQKYIADDWADDYGLSAETISYRHEANIDSDLSIRTTKSGIYLVDDVWVTGMPDDHGTFTGDDRFVADTATLEQYVLFFPDGVDVVEANRGQAQKIGETVTIPAKNGFYPSVGHTSWKALTDDNGDLVVGTYVFITEFAGDDRVQPLVTSVEDVTEQYTVNPAVQPILKTTATDTVDGDKILDPTPNASITDKVCDVNKSLIPGKTYTIVTDVVLATDGTSVLTKKVTTSFTPKSADECAEIVIPFDGSDLAGQKVVVFESVYDGDKLIAIHHDLTDADQTVQFADKPAPKPNGSLAKTGVSIGGLSLATGVLLALGAGIAFMRRKFA